MTFRALLIAKAVVSLVFGAFLLAAPSVLLGILGTELGPGGMFTGREYGAALVGTFLLTWFARDVKANRARGAILLDLLVYDAIGVIVTLQVVLAGVLNPLAWAIVGVYALFALGAGYLLILERPFSSTTQEV